LKRTSAFISKPPWPRHCNWPAGGNFVTMIGTIGAWVIAL
jgi:hypothetical protein